MGYLFFLPLVKWIEYAKCILLVKTKNIIIHSTTKFLDCIIKHYQGRERILL